MSENANVKTKSGRQKAQVSWFGLVGAAAVCVLAGALAGLVFGSVTTGSLWGLAIGVFVFVVYLARVWTGGVYVEVASPNLSQPGNLQRNHVICIDGTSMFKKKRGNVYRFYEYVQDDCKRYYRGVGVRDNKGVAQRVRKEEQKATPVGAATGHGATGILRRAYFDFVKEYRPGDRICIFGFSRGAAIARVLSSWICSSHGLPESVEIECLTRLTREDAVLDMVVKAPLKHGAPEIEMLGLWDTVAAFGNPYNDKDPFDFTIPSGVKETYHLVSIDETRFTFNATLIDQADVDDRVEEIWFAGAHSNIGGGLKDTTLSDIALRFMINRASQDHKLNFKKEAFEIETDSKTAVNETFWEAGWPWLIRITREIKVQGGKAGVLPRIHKSVFELKEKLTKTGCNKFLRNLPEVTARNAYKLEDRD